MHWKIEELPWDRLDPSKVDADLLQVVKAAALVEYNAEDYTRYLCNVFKDDPDFQGAAHQWSDEEVQHGRALGTWAERLDPSFNLERAMARFRIGYQIAHLDADQSIRGSRSGEMVARCMVETGTSSFYTAIADSTEEPVLQAMCRRIAADELRHYKLFLDYLKRYLDQEKLGKWARLRIAVGRILETQDDELAYAFYAANVPADQPYERERWNRAYVRRAYSYYRSQHVDRGVAMLFKACGLRPHTWFFNLASRFAWWVMESRTRRLVRMAA